MKLRIYDTTFDRLVIEEADASIFEQTQLPNLLDLGVDSKSYVTYADLQEHFDLSYPKISGYIKQLGIEPIGVVSNVVDGTKLRGKSYLAFPADSIDKIKNLLAESIDVESLKRMAAQVKKELTNGNSGKP